MTEQLPTRHCCEKMAAHLADPNIPIVYSPRFREYGLKIADGGSAKISIDFCPWCGSRLPESLRHEWFDRLERLGIEPEDKSLPDELKSDAWWRETGKVPASTHRS